MKQELVDLAEHQAEIYSLFSNPNRLQILWLLKNQELSVGDIAVAIGESMPNTSQYLRQMKDRNILETRRKGQSVFYAISANAFTKHINKLIKSPKRTKIIFQRRK